jgi:hypothetical protein
MTASSPNEISSPQDRDFRETVEKLHFDWPEFLPVERIKAGSVEMGLALLLFTGLVAVAVHLP